MMHNFLITTLLLLISVQLDAQNTILYGKAADYQAKEITFYTIPDPVLHQKLELSTTKIDNDGSFALSLAISRTTEIYTDLEKYRGTMVVEPGKSYQVELPPYSPRSSAEAHSIYFKPTPYWLGLPGTGNSDINFEVRSFLTDYDLETIKNTSQIYQQKSKEVVREIIERLEKKFANIQNPYFRTLEKYSFAELEYAVYQPNTEFVIKKYFAAQPIQPEHPAYQRAFETIFTDFLRTQSQEKKNNKIINFTNSGNYAELVAFFEDKGFRKEIAELVVLNGLYEGYYTGSFSKTGILKAIETAHYAASSTFLQTIAQQIKSKLTQLAVGEQAPAIKLLNQNKETVTLDQFKGKFVYLSFFNSSSSDCVAELDSIVSLEKKLRQVLSVVSVAVDENFNDASKLWKTKGYSWELLNGAKQKQLILNYNASITPVFYLIAPNGTLQLSQAPSPSHGFEPLFLKILRDSNFKGKPHLFKPGDFR